MSTFCSLGPTMDWPDTGDAGLGCCMGSALYGPDRCECWIPVYDQTQQQPRTEQLAGVMPRMCGDCAFRPDSPERRGDPRAASDADDLDELVYKGRAFWCHDGFLTPVAYVHPPSMTWLLLEGQDMHFDAPRVPHPDSKVPIPYRVDGRPGDLCAGWTARRLHHLQQEVNA